MPLKMLIDAAHPEETRVVVYDGSRVEEFDYETAAKATLSGNVYLARVTRVEPSLQAAFVDYGGGRHGFLAFSEIHPDYYQIPAADREALLAAEREAVAAAAREEEERAQRKRRRSAKVVEAAPADPSEAEANAPRGARNKRRRGGRRGRDDGRSIQLSGAAHLAEPPAALVAALDAGAIFTDGATLCHGPALGALDAAVDALDPSARARFDAATATHGQAHDGDGASGGEAATGDRAAAEEAVGLVNRVVDAAADAPSERLETVDAAAEDAADSAAAAPERGRLGASDDGAGGAEDGDAEEAGEDDDEDDDADDEEESDDEDDDEDDAVAEELSRESVQRRMQRMRDYKIQDVIKRRQIMLVQVVKEERGTKGAALTTYLSLAGRYCVLMPNTARGGGISRKITNAADRKRLKALAAEFEVPEGMGLIIRTAGANRTKPELQRDYEYLMRQWSAVRDLTLRSVAPTLIYEEGSLIKRTIRDLYHADIESVLVEGEEAYAEARDYMAMLMPTHANAVRRYGDSTPIFVKHQVDQQIAALHNPVVQLKSGGYIVIGVTEALVAIDVNSGRSTKEASIESTAVKTNLEAADEAARQLRLRDLAGLIVIDFIDMEDPKNNRAVEKRLKDALKTDRSRIQLGRISNFGLLEMSRQRLRPGLLESTTTTCPHCAGAGVVRSVEGAALDALRALEEAASKPRMAAVKMCASVAVANYLLNVKRARILELEDRCAVTVTIEADPTLTGGAHRIERLRSGGQEDERRPISRAVQVEAGFDDGPEPAAEALEPVEAAPARAKEEPMAADAAALDGDDAAARKRRGRRGGRRRRKGDGEGEGSDPMPVFDLEASEEAEAESVEEVGEDPIQPADTARSGRRRRNRGRRRDAAEAGGDADVEGAGDAEAAVAMTTDGDAADESDREPADATNADVDVEADQEPRRDPDDAPSGRAAHDSDHDADHGAVRRAVAVTPPPVEAATHAAPDVELKTEGAAAKEDATPAREDALARPGRRLADLFPEQALAAAEKPAEPSKPRRTGWWAFGRGSS